MTQATPQTVEQPAVPVVARKAAVRDLLFRRFGAPGLALVVAVALFLVGGIFAPGFTSPGQAVSILTIATLLALISLGQTLVVISGGEGLDLSVGAVLTLSAVITAAVINSTSGNTAFGIVAAVAASAIVGLANGAGIVVLKLPPLIVTLAISGVLAGLSLVLTNGSPSGGPSPELVAFVRQPVLLGLPAVTYALVILAIAVWAGMNRTKFGKSLFATGSNRAAARWSGMDVKSVVILTYGLAGFAGGIGGVVLTGYAGSVSLSIGNQYTLLSIAAVVVGGTLLAGGVGSFWGTTAGALLLTVLTAFLTALDLSPAWRQVLYGLIFLVLVLLYGREKSLRQ
ncbi:ABC transporter permease [Arthrobacter globiformis]|uniref:ABC transporter permease n=1 Tax=Arthrobacter globiformis TaxID=1665 RepID=UPI0027870484|nr:ABC transporter permease [Arthrobacter globiformis]MDQ0867341.1 ribose transport system permease protein [Arthrobacter globiformis]